MSALITVMLKELRDLSRDRRTLALALLLGPLLYPAMLLGIGKLVEMRAATQLEKPLEVSIVGAQHAPNLVAYLASQGIRSKNLPDDLDAAIRSQAEDVALVIDKDFAQQWRKGEPAKIDIVQDSTRRDAEIPVARIRNALQGYAQQMGALRLLARGINPSVTRPLNIGSRDLATAEAKRGMLLSFILPVLLLITAFIGGAYLILDATAGERERQSLEPLLATPASRGAIVSGKIAAACVIGLISLLLTLLSFKLSAQISTGMSRQLDVSFPAIGKMLLILVPMLLIGTALLSFLAAASKSMKEAQSHMTWLMLLPMLPGYVLMANPVKDKLWQLLVPFLAQNQMLLKVIRGEVITMTQWGVYLTAALVLAALLWLAAVWRYGQEKLAISA
ncbi:MAG: ABC transporter permease [Pseudomonadota bacterium]|nr:ABC transporter permease [Pseudomonadota bacterium]MDQ3057528.1 ABC transporter permease [Pseudomonadota bacterium]MDQ3229136.1 ABC transporter permease [Pseudomonadota bacterium]